MKTVLVLEGNEQDRGALQALLQDHGYTVTQKSDKALQVSEVAQDLENPDGNIYEKTPQATFRSSLDGKLYVISQAESDTFQVTKPPQGVEQHFRGIYEKGPLGIFRSSLAGKLLSINPAGARMLKYDSPREIIEAVNRTSIGEALYLDNNYRQEILAEVLESREWQVYEEQFRCKDGSVIDCYVHVRVVRDADGRPVELEGFLEDISERKSTERALRFSQFAIDKTMDQVLWMNEQGQFLYVNDAACATLGYSRLELVTMSIFDVDPDLTPEFVASEWQNLKRHGSETFERQHRTRDGFVYPVEARANYLVVEGQEYICFFVTDISERKRKEQALRFTQFAIDKSSNQAFWATEDARLFYVNDAACEALGYTRVELLQMSVPDIDPMFPAEVFAEYWRELKEKRAVTFETLHRAKDSRVYPVEMRVNFVVFDDKEYLCAFATDISERKAAEESLRLTQFAIDKTADQAFWGTPEGRFLYVNESACAALGYSREELVGMSISDIDPDFSTERLTVHWQELKKKGTLCFKSSHRTKDGRIYPVEIHSNYMNFDGKEYRCCFVTDISERKAAEEALRITQFAIDKMSDQAFWLTPEGRFFYVNEAACSALGYSREELLGMGVWEIDPGYSHEIFARLWPKLKKAGSLCFESQHRTKDGRLYPVEIRGNYASYEGTEYICAFAIDISQRKEAEEALGQARLIVESSPAVLFRWLATEGWPIEMVTRNVSRFGYTSEELLSGAVPYAALVHPQDLDRVVVELQAQISRGEDRFSQEYRIVTKQGEVRWVDERTVIERDAEGRVSHYQGIVMDINDRKRAEEALRRSERNYRSIVEHAPFGITHSTRDGKLLSVNPALAGILKYDSPEELLETTNRSSIQEVLFPEPSQRASLVERILTGNVWHVFDNRLLCKDGSVVTCRVHSRRILDEDGRESEFESFQENITDRLVVEEALRESEEKFRVLAETSPVAIYLYQGDKIIYANPATERLFGYSADELRRMSFWDWARDDFKEMVRDRGEARLRGEVVPAQYESCYVTKAGEDKFALVSAGVMEYQGRPTGVVFLLDISKRKRAEELVRDSLAEKEVLLREIHHRVKNNLQVVSSLLYLQSQKLTDPELQNHFLESQSRICSMALAHEQLYQSKSLADVSVKSYVESLVGQLRQVFQRPEQQIDCRIFIEDIVLDIEKVIPCGLLITELVSNAYKHAFADGRSGTITISVEQLGEQFALSVADDGVGLPKGLDYRQTTTLGLQLVTALANQLNGTVELEQEGGTLFRVTFIEPVVRDNQPDKQVSDNLL